jgi:Cd2+/Zn2+-exporting ATPase
VTSVWSVAASGVFIAAGLAASSSDQAGVALAAYVVAIGFSIAQPARRAFNAVSVRALDINVLMLLAVVGAGVLGEWFEAATVVWLFGIAQWLEVRSMERARRAIHSLVALAPSRAMTRRGGVEQEIAVADLAVGDVVIARPGDRVPADGVVLAGRSAVDQAPVTGESWPVDKGPSDDVFAGTINGTGALEIEVRHVASDSTLARIVQLVERAERQRAPVQMFVDRFARRYTPAVVLLAIAVAVLPVVLSSGATGEALATWSYRALALLVVACPCALVISTPVAVVSALTAAARQGVLVKSGTHLETLGRIRCVAFDKTGTLTDGRVRVTDVVALEGATSGGVLQVAAALESRSEHPIGRAIVDRARTDGFRITSGEGFRALPGMGAEAIVAAAPAVVGSHRWFEERGRCTPALHAQVTVLEGDGATPVLVEHGGAPLGVIGLAHEVRPDSRPAVEQLRAEGVERVVLLTGDHAANADVVRRAVGLDEAHADLSPEDKVAYVARLRARYGPVAMVGDGVNDAPALAAADVGIAMGAAGTALALETADVALMADELGKLAYAVRLARATLSNIRVNVGVALGLKLLFVVLAVSGLATLWLAVLADTGASLIVTANSLRLLRLR